jgi:hypothetical protein
MKENKILKWSLILSAVIVANLFFNYSLSYIFDAPEYSEFCDNNYYPYEKDATPEKLESQRMEMQKCNDDWQTAREDYSEKVFISLVSIGLVVLIASVLIKGNATVTSALALTAFLDFIIASMRYWQYSNELLKVGILFIALVIIFYIIVKKFKDSQ